MNKFMLKNFFLFILAILPLAAISQNDTSNLFNLDISDLYNIKVITATKKLDNIRDVPSVIIVIPDKIIRERNYTCVADLFRDLPQILVHYKSSSESLIRYTINGVSGNEKFLLMINGIRVTSSMGAEHTIAESYSLDNVKRVEVILGPGSVMYGADAFVGIVNLITYDYSQSQPVSFKAYYGRFNTLGISGLYSFKHKDFSLGVYAKYYYSSEPFMPEFYPEDFSWYNYYARTGQMLLGNDTIKPAIGILPWDMHSRSGRLDIQGHYKSFEFGSFNFYEQHSSSIGNTPSTAIYCKPSTYANRISNLYLRHHFFSRDSNLSITTTLSGQDFELLPFSAFINRFTTYHIAYKYERSHSVKLENTLVYKFRQSYLTFGAVAEHFNVIPKTGDLPHPYDTKLPPDKQIDMYYFGSDTVDYLGHSLKVPQVIYNITYDNYATYLQLKSRYEELNFIAGARFEYDTRYGFNWVPRIGFSTSPVDDYTFKLMMGAAYFAPSPHLSYQHFGTFIPVVDSLGRVIGLKSDFFRLVNPDLKIEYIQTYEMYNELRLKFLTIYNILFYNDLRNLITYQFFQDTSYLNHPVAEVMIPVNRGSGYSYGATIGGYLNFTFGGFGVFSQLSYTFIDGLIDNEPLLFNSNHMVKGLLQLSYKNKFTLDFSGEYRSPMYVSRFVTGYSPVYYNTRLSFVYNLFEKKGFWLKLFGTITNLTDMRMYEVTGGTFGFAPQDPLRFEFGLKLEKF